MRAILINPFEKKISEVEIQNTLEDLQVAVGDGEKVLITVACELPNGDVIYVDDEGLFKPNNAYFTVDGAHQPFAGIGLVVGSTKTGNSTNARSSIAQITSMVSMLSRVQLIKYLANELREET